MAQVDRPIRMVKAALPVVVGLVTLICSNVGYASNTPLDPALTPHVLPTPPQGVTVDIVRVNNNCNQPLYVELRVNGTKDLLGKVVITQIGQAPIETPYVISTLSSPVVTAKGPLLNCSKSVASFALQIFYNVTNKLMYEHTFVPGKITQNDPAGSPAIAVPQGTAAPVGPRVMNVSLVGSCAAATAVMDAEIAIYGPPNTGEAKVSMHLGTNPDQVVDQTITGTQHITLPTAINCAAGLPNLYWQLWNGHFKGQGFAYPSTVDYK
jgi:hypothetical protein